MKILYYLNPWIEKENPEFRFGALKNILNYQINNLYNASSEIEIKLIIGESTNYYIEKKQLELNQDLSKIIFKYNELKKFGITYENITSSQYHNIDNKNYLEYVRSKVGEFVPDFVISWEHPIDFFKTIYPSTKCINLMPGMYSRDPFPELTQIDLNGLFGKSTLNIHLNEIKYYEATQEELEMIDKIRHSFIDNFYNSYFSENLTDIFNEIENSFKYNILLPLQVSSYFAFTECCGFKNQFDYLYFVLSTIPSDIGVVVTQYNTNHTKDTPLSASNIEYLTSMFPNMIYSPLFEKYDSVSQLLIKYCDAIVTISSSIGFQGLLWEKPVFVIGDSHLNIISEGSDLSMIKEILGQEKTFNKDNILAFILTRLQVLTQAYLRDDTKWFLNYLVSLKEQCEATQSSIDLYQPFDNISNYTENFLNAKREEITLKKIPKEARSISTIITKRKSLAKKIDKFDVISFDIFDTLIERPFTKPTDLFRLLDEKVAKFTNNKIVSFSMIRSYIERRLKNELKEKTTHTFLSLKKYKQEVTLDEIYLAIQKEMALSDNEREEIKKLEIENEMYYLLPKSDMIDFFNYAIKKGKRVILVSDMYLPENVIIDILKKNLIFGYEKLYLSSTIKLTKHTGDLFPYVLNDMNINAKNLLHIGDNPHGDQKMPWKYKITTHLIKKNLDFFYQNKKMNQLFWNKRNQLTIGESAVLGLITRKHFNNTFKNYFNDTHFNQSTYNLGYIGLGWMFYSFTTWLIEEAMRDNIDTLYFLSRDGLIMKKVYDIVKCEYINPPKSVYLYASRRACQVAAIETSTDIVNVLNTNFTNTTIEILFLNKFGIDIGDIENIENILESYNYKLDSIVKISDRENLISFSLKIQSSILRRAKKERESYLEYLNTMHLSSGKNAIVDIGYAGTMQKSLMKLIKINQLGGYYFMTFLEAKKLTENFNIVKGYAGDFVNKAHSTHPICKLGLLFEVVFSNTEGSLLYFEEGKPVLEKTTNEDARKRLITLSNKGIVNFSLDFCKVFKKDLKQFTFDNFGPMLIFIDFLTTPSGRDTDIMVGVNFDDSFGTTHMRYMLPNIGQKLYEKEILWKKGYQVYLNRGDIKVKKEQNKVKKEQNKVKKEQNKVKKEVSFFIKIEKFIVQNIVNGNKLNKYKKNRQAFFKDSSNKYIRLYYKLIG